MAAARSAYNLIDMTRHNGEHPRIGALVNQNFRPNICDIYFEGCGAICSCSKCDHGGLY